MTATDRGTGPAVITLRLIPDDPSREARMVNAAAFREAFDRCARGQSGEVIARLDGVAFPFVQAVIVLPVGGSDSGGDEAPGIQIGSSGRYFLPNGTSYLEAGPYRLSLEHTLDGLK